MTAAGHLDWPFEGALAPATGEPKFASPGSNISLDFHGDPSLAGLVVFSDGNHHMALGECVSAFRAENPDVVDVFYATTPPGPLVQALEKGRLHVGNLTLSLSPHVFIGPAEVLDQVVAAKAMESHRPFAESRGNVLLVPKGNPKGIQGVGDLFRDDVVIAISNPKSEKASFRVYSETITALAEEAGLDGKGLASLLASGGGRVVYSTAIHHREVPEILARGGADVTMVYYHLALRYSRIFPDILDLVPLGGGKNDPDPGPGHSITRYHIGLVGDGGPWGGPFRDFMTGAEAAGIYESHGLGSVE